MRCGHSKDSKELYQWWLDCSRGQDIGSESRRFDLLDTFPTRWDTPDISPSSSTATESVTMKFIRLDRS